jgi:hypothetical protein
METYTECQPLLVSRGFSFDYHYPYIGTLLNWPVVWTQYDKPHYSRFLTNRNAWAVAWWSSTQKPIKSPGAIWIVFWVCPVKRPEPRQGSCWQLEVVPWRKKIWYVVLELHFVTRLGLTSTLIVCTGPWHLKGRKRCHCYVLYCSLHSVCNTVHKKCPRWKNKNCKKYEDFISYPQKKRKWEDKDV